MMAGNKFGLDGKLGGSETKRFASDGFGDSIHLEKNICRADDRNPGLKRALAFAHSGFQRLFGEGLLRKNTDPHLAVALHVAGDGDAGGFDLLGIEPATFKGHQTILAKGDRLTARSQASATATVHFAVLYSFGH